LTEIEDAGAPTNLREATLSGVKWTTASRILAEIGVFAASVMLARLIPPAEFGLTAVAVFVATLARGMSSQGIGSFIVQLDSPTSRHYRAAVLLCLMAGLVGSGLTLIFAATASDPLFGSRATELLLIATPVTLVGSFSAVPLAQLQRSLDFRRLGTLDALSSLSAPVTAVGLAVAGLDGEAIILGLLVSVALTSVLSFAWSRPARPGWHRREMREILGFGAPTTGSSLLYTAVRNIDYVILAASLPAAQVGYYVRAFLLGSDYQSKISGILLRISFPVLSRARDLAEMRRIRARMIRVHATLLFPLLFGLIAVAPTFVPWLYGENWEPAGELAQILAIGGMIAAVGTGTGPLLLATGHPRALFLYNLIGLFAYTATVLIAVPYGVVTVCWAVVGMRLFLFLVLQYAIVERKVGIPMLATLRDDALPAVVGGVPQMLVTMAGLDLLAPELPTFLALAIPGLAGLVVYVLIVRTFFAAAWRDLALLFGRLFARSRPAP
jgi:O-antigen/teichoic acid export membrane protein